MMIKYFVPIENNEIEQFSKIKDALKFIRDREHSMNETSGDKIANQITSMIAGPRYYIIAVGIRRWWTINPLYPLNWIYQGRMH